MSDQIRDTNFLELLSQQEKTARYLQKWQSNEDKYVTNSLLFFLCMPIAAKESVHFDEKMTVHGLICPNEIFYCVRPTITDVIFENIPAIRTIKSESGTYFCYCNNCKFMGERCKVSPCPDCHF